MILTKNCKSTSVLLHSRCPDQPQTERWSKAGPLHLLHRPHLCTSQPVISTLHKSVSDPSMSFHSHNTPRFRAATLPGLLQPSPERPPCLSLCRLARSPRCGAALLDWQSDDVLLPAWKPLTALRVQLEFLIMTFHTHCPGNRNSSQFPKRCQILSCLQNCPRTLPLAWVSLPCLLALSEAGICTYTFASSHLTHSTTWILSSLVPQRFPHLGPQ